MTNAEKAMVRDLVACMQRFYADQANRAAFEKWKEARDGKNK